MAIPRREHPQLDRLLAQADTVLLRYEYSGEDDESREEAVARTLQTIVRRIEPPARRLEHGLHPWTTYLILPIFALANAGVDLGGSFLDLLQPVSLGIILGLTLGRPFGITAFAWIATRLGVAAAQGGGLAAVHERQYPGWDRFHGVAVHHQRRL